MKRLWLFASCIVLLLLISCAAPETKNVATSEEDLPPEPAGLPGTGAEAGEDIVGQAYKGQKAEGYAPPVDVYAKDEPQIVFVSPEIINRELEDLDEEGRAKPEPVRLRVEFPDDKSVSGLVYKQYGYYDSRQKKWEMKEFPQRTVGGSKWIRTKAEAGLVFPDLASGINYELPDGLNYFAVYFCRKHEGVWRCGWDARHDNDGKGGMWGLITLFKRNVLFPPSPVGPGAVVSKRAWLSPTNGIYLEGEMVGVGVRLESKQQDLTADVVSVDVKDASGAVVASADVRATDDHQVCDAEILAESRDLFGCERSYGGEVNAPAGGEYSVVLKGAGSDTVVEEGSFKVITQADVDANVIRKGIGEKTFGWFWADYSDEYERYSVAYFGSWITAEVLNDLTSGKTVVATRLEELRKRQADGEVQLVEVEDSVGVKHKVYYWGNAWSSGNQDYYYKWLTRGNERIVGVEYYGYDEGLMDDEEVVVAYLEKHPSVLTGEVEEKRAPVVPTTTTATECADGIDNDGDDLIDADDAGCSDDDGNYAATLDNEGADNEESFGAPATAAQCGDGNDNDGDGFTDYIDEDEDGESDFIDEDEDGEPDAGSASSDVECDDPEDDDESS